MYWYWLSSFRNNLRQKLTFVLRFDIYRPRSLIDNVEAYLFDGYSFRNVGVKFGLFKRRLTEPQYKFWSPKIQTTNDC